MPVAIEDVLRDVGISEYDESNPLHVKIRDALFELGPSATVGQRVVALRWIFNWELTAAGKEFGTAKADYERHMAREKVRQMATDPKVSVAKAETYAEADDESYRLKLTYLLAEQRERAMRHFLQTLDAMLDNHRSDRADWRAGDRAHSQGLDGAS